MEWLSHNENFLTTECFLVIGGPSLEDILGVWEQDGIVFGFGLFNDLEELSSNLRCGRDASIGGAPEDQEHILAFFNRYILLFIAIAAAGRHWWEVTFIISLSTAVEDSYDETVVHFAQRAKSCLQVVKRDLFLRVRHDDLAHVVLHHSVSTVVDYCQRLFVGVSVVSNPSLEPSKDLFDGGQAEVCLL